MGTVAAASLPLIFTILLAFGMLHDALNGNGNLWPSFWLAVSPLTLTLPIVLLSCAFLGLPTAQILRFLAAENERNYVASGAMWGSLVPVAILLCTGAQEGWWVAFLGGFSGGVCGATWWRSTAKD